MLPCGSANPLMSPLVARRLHALRVVTFGTPSYFSEHGRPEHPKDLDGHQCILRAGADVIDKWTFRIEGKLQTVKVNGRFRTNSAAAIRAAASEGLGLARLPLWQIRDLVDEGEVVIVLSEFETEGMPIQLVWPPTKAPLERMRRFVDFLSSGLQTDLLKLSVRLASEYIVARRQQVAWIVAPLGLLEAAAS